MRGKLLALILLVESAALVAACGARTQLPIGTSAKGGGEGGEGGQGGVIELPDSGHEEDAPPDVIPDVIEEGLPLCDPDALYVYLVTSETDLYRYNPANNQFVLVGALACPTGGSPFSMGVSRKGTAYVVYNTGELFQVSTEDASCEALDFVTGQQGFDTFGMGFAIDDDQMGETLHVAEINFNGPSEGLATIDLTTLELSFIGPFSENPGNAIELTSSDDGQLYGYFLDPNGNGGYIVQIEKHTAEILDIIPIAAGDQSSALAFAHWGGNFYVFTSPGGTTTVTRYMPSDQSVAVVATLGETVVGAGVSTCTIPM